MLFSTSAVFFIAISSVTNLVAGAPAFQKFTNTTSTTFNGTNSYNGTNSTNFSFPLSDGFPNPNTTQLHKIEVQGGSTLPVNVSSLLPVDNNTITSLKLIALNELAEVAFFTELLSNITHNQTGYEIYGTDKTFIVDSLESIIAQEELHALYANHALEHLGVQAIQPCKYVFPVDDVYSAFVLAGTFTDLVLGTLQDVISIAAENKDKELARAISSVVGQEGEQEGFFRILQDKTPSASAFLTTSTRDFAFSALQGFTVPGSCPSIEAVHLKTFGQLNLLSSPTPTNDTLKYAISAKDFPKSDADNLALVLINGQNAPLVEKLKNIQYVAEVVTFEADFLYTKNLLYGLTIAVVTSNAGPFSTADAVANATLFGPALIEVR